MINGKQMTICFHVDDCKLSHKSSSKVTKMVEILRSEYESIFEDGSGKMKSTLRCIQGEFENWIKTIGAS